MGAKVQLLCKDHSSSGISKNLNSKQHLSRLATSLFDDACFVRASVHQDDNIPDVQILLIHDAVYHQCQIVLHAMIVPLFSGAPTDPIVDPETQRKAAETVTHHADLFEHLLTPYLYNREDVSRVPPLVGYGAFVVGIVILSTQISRHNQSMSESTVNTGGMENRLAAVEAILRLIGSLRIYWRALQHPWETLHSALKAGRSVLRKSSRLIESQDIQPSEYSNNNRLSTTLEESNQPMNLENAHPQPSATYRNARKYTEDSQPSATSRDNGGSGLDSLVDMTANDSSMSQIGLLPDPEWYSLSFAEAGVEQFCGLEPSILFQQGWKVFS
ncbi:hypothetical protein VI817_008452 [Penicillium citrinum]|nr:hypothetical protein VI817_008452 [Penicillium citrinum]